MRAGFKSYLVIFVGILFMTSFFVTLATVAGGDAVGEYEISKIDPELRAAQGIVKLRVNLNAGVKVKTFVNELRAIGAEIYQVNTESVNYVNCIIDTSEIFTLASMPEVMWMQQEFEPQTLMDQISTNTYLGTDTPQSFGYAGAGILAEVVDDGIDIGHPDLAQVQYTDFSPTASSHGTCTSGIMFGNGAGDPDALGHANQATGVFADWMNGNAITLSNLWDGTFSSGNAGMNGVVQTNSWWNGATMDAQYDAMSNEIDQSIVDHPKVLTHWAIGNSNHGTAKGVMSAESISKNNMAVGAIFHENTASMADDNWNSLSGSGATPSRGPAADGRMKPDMLAMFDWIYTVDQRGGAGYTGTDYYDDFGGTSGATPNVAGCSVIAYGMYVDNYFDNNPTGDIPYSCTIKALMIADGQQYPMPNGDLIDRDCQGWGAPDMENMYNLGATYHVFEEYPQALNAGDMWTRQVYSDGTIPLKITIAWIDPAAPSSTLTDRALINNLNLKVISPGGTTYYGNNGLYVDEWSASGTAANHWYDVTAPGANYNDNLNNVENVFIQTPASGVWTIEVSGQVGDIGSGPQDFSMVASGAQGISSMGTIALDRATYLLEDVATVTVSDLDLNTLSGVAEIVEVTVDSTTEPLGELLTLTETGPDTSTFENTITISATNGAGILQVSDGDTITATYNDEDDGTGSPALQTDTASVDGSPPGPPTGLSVTWTGTSITTFLNEDFSGGFPPAGWSELDPTGNWNQATSSNAGGTSPEARFNWISQTNIWRLYAGPLDTSGMTALELEWRNFNDDWGSGVTCRIETSSNGVSWNPTGWEWISGTGNRGPLLDTYTITTADVGSSSFYISWTVDGNAYQLDYWYIDNVVLSYLEPSTDDNTLDWTLSADDGGGDNDVAWYHIYRANNAGGPWGLGARIDTVPAGTTTYTDPGRGEIDFINWWYVVRAEDNVGNEELNTNAVPEIPTGDTPPTVTVTAPNGGEVFMGGGSTTITWTAVPGTNPLLPNPIIIEYSTTGPAGPWFLVSSNEPNDGTYTWNPIPLVDSMNSFIRITATDTIGYFGEDFNDNAFAIDSTAPSPASGVFAELNGINDVTIYWTSSPAPDVDHYDVYYIPNGWDPTGDTYLKLNGADINPFLTSYTHTGVGVNNANSYFYQLRTYDVVGHETRTIIQAGKIGKDLDTGFSLSGWFMMGSPLVQSDTSLGHVLQGQGLVTNMDYVQAYDAFDATDQWKSFLVNRPPAVNDLTDITNEMGFWIHVTANSRWCTAGYVSDMAIPMKAGWNLVSYPYALASRTAAQIDADLMANCPGYDSISLFDPTQPYRLWNPVGPETVQQGYGIWVHVSADTTWTVTNY